MDGIGLHTSKELTMSTLLKIATLVGIVVVATPAAAEKVYKWVDSDGVTHYQAHPPKNLKTETLITKTGHSAPSVNAAKEQSAELASAEIETQKASDAECEKARANLNLLNQGQRVRIKDDNGDLVYLDDSQKAAKRAEAQRFLDQAC